MSHPVRDQWTTLPSTEGELEMRLYSARPDDTTNYPSLIVIHEAFGLEEHIQDLTRRFAAEGYVAVAPDLFSVDQFGRTVAPEEIKEVFGIRRSLPAERRNDPAALDEALNTLPAERAARLREVIAWSARRDIAALVSSLEKVVAWTRERTDTTDAVGVVGFCFGGGMVLRLAFAGAPISAAAPFYGQNPPLEQASAVRCPLLLMYGRKDPFIMPGVPALLDAIQRANLTYEVHIYEEAGHAFLNDTRPEMYHAPSAHDAWNQTRRFFARHLC
jgi:carboxymethylenebutenolidase